MFAAVMDYCGPRGLPYTAFLDWDSLSQDAALAWSIRERDRCGECGLPRHDLLDDDGIELRELPYIAEPVYCPGCAVLDAARKKHTRLGVHIAWRSTHEPEHRT